MSVTINTKEKFENGPGLDAGAPWANPSSWLAGLYGRPSRRTADDDVARWLANDDAAWYGCPSAAGDTINSCSGEYKRKSGTAYHAAAAADDDVTRDAAAYDDATWYAAADDATRHVAVAYDDATRHAAIAHDDATWYAVADDAARHAAVAHDDATWYVAADDAAYTAANAASSLAWRFSQRQCCE